MKFFGRGSSKEAAKQAKHVGPRELTKRDVRYSLRAPLRYRNTGQMGWRNGTTINMSKSGILFSGESLLAPGARIEVSVSLPQKGSDAPKVVTMSCVITRHRETEPGEKLPVMAAKVVK